MVSDEKPKKYELIEVGHTSIDRKFRVHTLLLVEIDTSKHYHIISTIPDLVGQDDQYLEQLTGWKELVRHLNSGGTLTEAHTMLFQEIREDNLWNNAELIERHVGDDLSVDSSDNVRS